MLLLVFAHRIAPISPCRGNLAATCTALRTSGRCWFRGVVVRVRSGDRCRLAELKQWVEERQGARLGGKGHCAGRVAGLERGKHIVSGGCKLEATRALASDLT